MNEIVASILRHHRHCYQIHIDLVENQNKENFPPEIEEKSKMVDCRDCEFFECCKSKYEDFEETLEAKK